MSRLFIRVDDFPGTRPDEFDRHNLENFKLFDEVVVRHFPGYVLGVIPKHTTDEQLDWLRSRRHIELALHGRNHDERFPNEFGDWETEEEVYQAIVPLRARLHDSEGFLPRIYIPPHNVIDRKTVNALFRAGFEAVLGGPGSDAGVISYAVEKGMTAIGFYPPFNYGRSDELLTAGAVEHLTNMLRSGNTVPLGLHWTWEMNIGLGNLDRFLSELRGMIGQ